ncbi:MAG: hypothetical protein Q4F80_02610 [bacterium]|nr:hypothetical protein [bacterium]
MQTTRSNSTAMGTAFQKTNCRKPHMNSKTEHVDVFMRMAEASMANSPRGKQMDSELKSMGLV